MKHIDRFKLFEDISNYIPEYIRGEIKDMSTELEDDEYEVRYDWSISRVLVFYNYAVISIYRSKNNKQLPVRYEGIKNYVERVRKYLESEGYMIKAESEDDGYYFVIKIYNK